MGFVIWKWLAGMFMKSYRFYRISEEALWYNKSHLQLCCPFSLWKKIVKYTKERGKKYIYILHIIIS
jgi:hypothetical protein